ncbi:Rho GTPase-activating protein 35-like [Oopsacas minuta]|uniref:Rho GTPase-activating protein 35-like n=1 Tax=Oopsacas minuta TaxID=111878 RepID=A0AAV7JS49_9METZ|nr:Rho GTPase-activating protein 35-like [Oopsacas minuta]
MKLRISVVSSPCNTPQEDGVGKSSLCQQFIYGRQVRVKKRWTEQEWQSTYINKNHFLYWGSLPLRLPDGTETLIRLIEQTTIWRPDQDALHPAAFANFPKQAAQTCLPSPGKTCSFPEHVSMYTHIDKRILKSDGRVVDEEDMLFPHQEFVDEGINGFLCIIDPTMSADRMSRQIQFLKSFVNLAKPSGKKLVFILTKCDLASEKQLIDARHIVRNKLKHQAPILEVSTVEMHNIQDSFVTLAQRCLRIKPIIQVLTWLQHKQAKMLLFSRQIAEYREYLLRLVEDSSWTWDEFWQQLKSSSQSFLAANIQEGELKRLFCLHILELKLKEAGAKYSMNPEDKTYLRLTSSQASESAKSYQEFLFNSIKAHPDLTPNYSRGDYSHYASVDTKLDPSTSMSPIFPPPLPPRTKESDELPIPLGSPILPKSKSKLFGSKKLRKTMSWGGKSQITIENSSQSNDNILMHQSPTEYEISLFHSMLGSSTPGSQFEDLPANKDDTFRRRAKTTSSGKYLHRPLPPSPGFGRSDKPTFPKVLPSGTRNSPQHTRSRSDQLSIVPANLSFPDLSRISVVDLGEPAPYLDPMELKLHTLPRFRHSQASVEGDSAFQAEFSPKRLIKRENSFPLHDFNMRHSLDPIFSSNITAPIKTKIDASVQTYLRGERRRESRWESNTPKLSHRKRDISTSCACIQENTNELDNEQDSGTASFICTPPPPPDPQTCDPLNPVVMYDIVEPV